MSDGNEFHMLLDFLLKQLVVSWFSHPLSLSRGG
jgi:hypothetical protein